MQVAPAIAVASPRAGLLRAILVLRSIELAFMLASRVAILAISASSTSLFAIYDRVTSITWALLSISGLALIAMLARNLGSHPAAKTAWWAVGLATLDTAVSLFFTLESLVGSSLLSAVFDALGHAAVTGPMMALGIAFDVLFWLLLVRLGQGALTASWSIVYAALRGSALLLALPSLLPHATYRALFIDSPFGTALNWSRFAFAFAHGLTVILALSRVARVQPGAAGEALTLPTQAKASPQRDMIVGGLWLAGGLIVTLASYSLASSGGGGKYLITTGAIAYGLARLVRGLIKSGQG
jgi:hypothetical protein